MESDSDFSDLLGWNWLVVRRCVDRLLLVTLELYEEIQFVEARIDDSYLRVRTEMKMISVPLYSAYGSPCTSCRRGHFTLPISFGGVVLAPRSFLKVSAFVWLGEWVGLWCMRCGCFDR